MDEGFLRNVGMPVEAMNSYGMQFDLGSVMKYQPVFSELIG